MVVEEVIEIDTAQIEPYPDQPRKEREKGWVERLAISLKKRGQKQPAIVTPYYGPKKDGIVYYLVEGENRWRAAKLAGLRLRAIVRKMDSPKEHFRESATANFFRLNHTPLEIANVIKFFYDEEKMTWQEISAEIGYNELSLRLYYDLNGLAPEFQQLVKRGVPKGKRLPIHVGSELGRLPHDEQKILMDEGGIVGKGVRSSLAIQKIRRRIEELEGKNVKVFRHNKGRRRKPSDDLKLVETHLKRVLDSFQLIEELMTQPTFERALTFRGKEANALILDSAGQVRLKSTVIFQKIEKAMPEAFQKAVATATGTGTGCK